MPLGWGRPSHWSVGRSAATRPRSAPRRRPRCAVRQRARRSSHDAQKAFSTNHAASSQIRADQPAHVLVARTGQPSLSLWTSCVTASWVTTQCRFRSFYGKIVSQPRHSRTATLTRPTCRSDANMLAGNPAGHAANTIFPEDQTPAPQKRALKAISTRFHAAANTGAIQTDVEYSRRIHPPQEHRHG